MEKSASDELALAKTELIAELRKENEKLLDEYKLSLQKEFKQQLEQVTMLALSRPGQRGGTVVEYDRNASTSFQMASLSNNNQPKIHVYEQNTGKRSAIVRSGKEELTLPTKHITVRTSGPVIHEEIEEIIEQAPLQVSTKLKQQPEAPEHLKAKYGTPISPLTAKKPKRLTPKKLTNDTVSVVDSPSMVSSNDNIQDVEKKFDGVTKFFLRKSEMLIKDAMEYSSPSPSKKKPSKYMDSPLLMSGGSAPLFPSVYSTHTDVTDSPSVTSTQSKLPQITRSKGGTVSPKKSKVKAIADDGGNSGPQQPPRPPSPIVKDDTLIEWESEHKRVNNVPPEMEKYALTSDKWENDIARHILSVFATQKTSKDKSPASHLMEYVDNNHLDDMDSIKSYVSSSSNIEETVQGIVSSGKGDEAYTYNAMDGADNNRHSKRSPMKASREDKELTEEEKMTKFITDLAKNSKYRTTIMARTQLVECDSPTRVDFRYRSKPLRKGVEVALRSSPKVFQIWFISTGELDTNWSMLPGGKALQAQLTQSYENKQFSEYLQTIEALILQLWSTVSGYVADSSAIAGRGFKVKEEVDLKALNQPKPSKKTKKSVTSAAISTATTASNEEDPFASKYTKFESMWGDDQPDTVTVDDSGTVVPAKKKKEFNKETVSLLWEKFLYAANAVVVLNIEKREFDVAMDILTKLEKWYERVELLPANEGDRQAVRAQLYESFSYFFYKKQKNPAALNNCNKACEIYESLNNVEMIAISLIHVACVHCQSLRYKESHACLQEFLGLIDEGRLAIEETNVKYLCLVAVAYHNLAVVQLKLDVPDLAAKSSQSAKKIARLCLSYSNRWIKEFEHTHNCAVEEIKFQMAANHGLQHDHIKIMDPVIEELYDDGSKA